MIESRYWKDDLLKYAQSFKPMKTPPRWSENGVVQFEKNVVLAFFMIRKLSESCKLSSKTMRHTLQVFRCPCLKVVNKRNFSNIQKLYDFDSEEPISKGVTFISNQFIHGAAMYSYREIDRNWGGIYTCSDFERNEYIYRIPLVEIVKLLQIAGSDYPTRISMSYDDSKGDYDIEVD